MIGRIVDEFRPSRVIEDNDRAAYLSTENPRFRRAWASRARRRRLAALSAAVSAASVPLLAAAVALPSQVSLLFALAFAVAAFASAVLATRLNKATRMSLPYRLLDERQRAERDRSVRFGHRGTTVLLFAGLLAAGAPSFLPGEPVFPAVLALPLLWTLIIAHTSLPALHAAWTQPDEVVDDPDA
ncbi:hypothetical protein [Nocardiopsis flavescens]